MNVAERLKTIAERADMRETFDAMYEPMMLVAAGMIAGMVMVPVIQARAKANAIDALVLEEVERDHAEVLQLRAELEQSQARIAELAGEPLALPHPPREEDAAN